MGNDQQQLFRWGILGPGQIAREFINDLQFVQEAKCSVAAVLGRDEKETQKFAQEYGISASFTDLNKMLEESKLNAVYVATPHPLHYEHTLTCLKHRIPVLCEKPLALNKEQAEEMVGEAEKYQTYLMDGIWIRFLPSIIKVLELIQEGVIGNVISLKADMCYRAPQDENNRFFNPDLGGGSLLDLGIYPVFLSLLLLGNPAQVKAVGMISDEGVDESCAALLGYKSGQYGIIESSIVSQTEKIATIYGEKGIIRIQQQWNEKPNGIIVETYAGDKQEFPCEWEGRGLHFEATEFIKDLKMGRLRNEKITHKFSLDILRVLDEIRRQIRVKYPMYE